MESFSSEMAHEDIEFIIQYSGGHAMERGPHVPAFWSAKGVIGTVVMSMVGDIFPTNPVKGTVREIYIEHCLPSLINYFRSKFINWNS